MRLLSALALVLLSACSTIALSDVQTPRPAPDGSCLVVGFLGGRDRWNDETKGVRQLAVRLSDPATGVYAETFENRRRDVALAFVRQAVAGRPVRLVVYGQSFGGAAVTKFARQLEALAIPIALTVQIDSVGLGDGRIPPNVRQAANLYQDNGRFIRGEHPVVALDPARTIVLGNFRFDYDSKPGSDVSLAGVSWFKRALRVAHTRMDRDPRVWSLAEQLVRAACAGSGRQ